MTVLATVVFFSLYPTHFLIADEAAYFGQAQTWAAGRTAECTSPLPCSTGESNIYLPGDYPAGTGLLAAFCIQVTGVRAVFWGSFVCWLAGTWALGFALRDNGQLPAWAFFPWLYLPAALLTRTLMSELPSFALAALFLYLVAGPNRSRGYLLGAGWVAGLAILFRETNVLWALPFLIGALVRRTPYAASLWAGFVIGLTPRYLSAALLFGHPLYVRDPGIGFSIHAFPKNLAFYLFALLVLLPGGLWWLAKSRWPFRQEAFIAAGLFLSVYGCYEYDAFAKSGYKALVLQGRFLIPLLPALTLAAACGPPAFHRHSRRLRTGLLLCAGVFFLTVQVAGWRFNRAQQRITAALYQVPGGRQLSFTPDETRKYINGLAGPMVWYAGDQLTRQQIWCDTVWYAHILSRGESMDQEKKALTALSRLQQFWLDTLPAPSVDISATDGSRLRVWKLTLPAGSSPENKIYRYPHEQTR